MDVHLRQGQNLILICICSFVTIITTFSIPPASLISLAEVKHPNVSNNSLSISNLPILNTVDPAFGFMPYFGGDMLPPTSCLMNSVNAALGLALGDFEGAVPYTVYQLSSYPDVEIAIVPNVGEDATPMKYAVWGVNVGIDWMMRNAHFQTTIFLLTYRDHPVGSIQFIASGATGTISAKTLDTTPSTLSNSQHMVLLNQTLARFNHSLKATPSEIEVTDDPALRVAFVFHGTTLTTDQVFHAVLDMLRELADYKRTVRINDDRTLVISAGVEIITNDANNPPRTASNPPYFEAEWLMRALAAIPAHMLADKTFSEVDATIFVDDIEVGHFSLWEAFTPSTAPS